MDDEIGRFFWRCGQFRRHLLAVEGQPFFKTAFFSVLAFRLEVGLEILGHFACENRIEKAEKTDKDTAFHVIGFITPWDYRAFFVVLDALQ